MTFGRLTIVAIGALAALAAFALLFFALFFTDETKTFLALFPTNLAIIESSLLGMMVLAIIDFLHSRGDSAVAGALNGYRAFLSITVGSATPAIAIQILSLVRSLDVKMPNGTHIQIVMQDTQKMAVMLAVIAAVFAYLFFREFKSLRQVNVRLGYQQGPI